MPSSKSDNNNPLNNETDLNLNQESVPGEQAQTAGANRPSSISDALKLIDTVISRDGANLKEMVTSEYSNLKSTIDNFAPSMGEKVNTYGTQAIDAIAEYATEGYKQGRKIAGDVDTQVRANPWPIIGGVALSALAIGFMLGKANPSNEPTEFH